MIEKQIRELLNQEKNHALVLDRLALLWDDPKISDQDLSKVACYFFRVGQFERLARLFAVQVIKRKSLHFETLARLIEDSQIELTEKEKSAFLEAAEMPWVKEELTHTTALDQKIPDIRLWRAQLARDAQTDLSAHRDSLFEQLELACLQRLKPEEDRILAELQGRFPGDQQVAEQLARREETTAQQTLKRHESNRVVDFDYAPHLEAEDSEWLDTLLVQWQTHLAEKPNLWQDAALFFLHMEAYHHALQILRTAPQSEQRDWLLLETLINAKQFFLALSLCDENEMLYADQPETMFSTLFARARCYFGLGHKETAIEILRSILNVRAHFRSASALLQEWTALHP